MLEALQFGRRTLLTSLACASVALVAAAQKADSAAVPAAPIPPGIAAAKTVFLPNVCELTYSACAPVYNTLYDGIGKQGKYQLVSSPSQADLIFEIHFNATRLLDGDTEEFFQLKIVDRASNVPLWAITETTNQASAADAVLLDLSVLGRPGETAGPVVKFPKKK